MKRLTLFALLFVLFFGCATNKGNDFWSRPENKNLKPEELVFPLYTFSVTVWHESTFQGMPFYLQTARQGSQDFVLICRQGNAYLRQIGYGTLQRNGLLWISWSTPFKPAPRQTLTFELCALGPNRLGVSQVSLLGDEMFLWQGDTPVNLP